ncbi:MAG: Rieske 2Fe-2S domain-containing protein [Thermodesulfobacteriota bacterium]
MTTETESTAGPSQCPGGCSGPDMSESRRSLMRGLGWGAFFTTLALSLAGSLRFFFPRVLFEPPTTFKIGTVKDYPAGSADKHGVISVSEQFMESQRVWIVRESDKLYAIFGKCTHLGCTPKWFADERQFKCPCHGSQYYSNGVNFAGPAPRPMDRYGISRMEDGRIVVDKSKLYTVNDFEDPDCFLQA